MWNLESVTKEIENSELSPKTLADMRLGLAGQYAMIGGKLSNILFEKPKNWTLLRATVKSDSQAERIWQATDIGLEEMKLRLLQKGIEKMMSALKTKLEIMVGESHNQF